MSSFAVGLLFGQMSVLLVVGIVVRFFLFADGHSIKSHTSRTTDVHVTPSEEASTDSLLEQTYYDVKAHPSETMDWFTVFLALVIREMRQQAASEDQLLNILNQVVNSEKIPNFVGGIKITELHLGSDYPLLSNCKVVQVGENLEVQFDIDLKDRVTLGIDTQLLLSYPKPMLASLPVSGSVSLVSFSGRVRLGLGNENGDSYLSVSLDPTYNMEFKIESLIGSRAQLRNVPKIGQLIESGLRKVVDDRCVAPKCQKIKLPKVGGANTATANAVADAVSSVAAEAVTTPVVSPATGATPASPTTSGTMPGTPTPGSIPSFATPVPTSAPPSAGKASNLSFSSGADRGYLPVQRTKET